MGAGCVDGDVRTGPRGQREGEARLGNLERACASPTAVARRVQAISSVDARQYLPGIALPTLVIHRAGDRAVPVHHGRYLARAIQGARYLEMPGGDHVPSAEEAQVLLGAFAEFLADPAVATPGARPGTLVERPT